jgi:hypothetical protein
VPDLEQFSRRITVRAERVAQNADRLIRKVALAVDQAVVHATPVDTGRARSNWIAQLGSPSSEIREPYAPGDGLGASEAANAQAATDQALSAIAQYRSGQEIHITNNLPYIQKLNDGHSAQAPENFVEQAIQAGINAIPGTRIVEG